jgi:ferredoxin
MIKIELENCNVCGLCTKICHEHCLQIENDILSIDYKYCSTCTQCIAICPHQAITWNNVMPEQYDKSIYPDFRQIEELFMERRSVRDYKNQKIDKSILEEITGFAIYAPTHNFNFRAIIIDDEQIIKEVDLLIYKFSVNIYKWFYKPMIIHWLLKKFAPYREFEYLKAMPKLENVQKRNSGFKTKPSSIIMIVGDKRTPFSKESAQYAIYNIDLYAQSKGIACSSLVGNQMVLNKNKEFRKLIGLDKNESIFGSIAMGYSAVRFRNKVLGEKMQIQWNAIRN